LIYRQGFSYLLSRQKLTRATDPACIIFCTLVPTSDKTRIRYLSSHTRVQTAAIPACTTRRRQIPRMRLRDLGVLRISQQTCDRSSWRGFHKLIKMEKSTKKRRGVVKNIRTFAFTESVPVSQAILFLQAASSTQKMSIRYLI